MMIFMWNLTFSIPIANHSEEDPLMARWDSLTVPKKYSQKLSSFILLIIVIIIS